MARYHRGVSGARGWSPRRVPLRRVARLVGWNALVLFALLLLAGGGAEVWLRLTAPSASSSGSARQLAPGVGVLWAPMAEVRHENAPGDWQVSRANSLGFLDREPPGPERAAESCHVTFIGDSFVEGVQVPVADKTQVVLEELAARELPALDVTTSAFSHYGTGQMNQLAFYDAYVRDLSPDLLVLVVVRNDFGDNSLALSAWLGGFDPEYPPWLFARRGADGEMEFVPPAADLEELRANRLPRLPLASETPGMRMERKLREWSYFADWLWGRYGGERSGGSLEAQRLAWAELISQRPPHATFLHGWDPAKHWTSGLLPLFLEEDPPPTFREALDTTRFALKQFRERAERDGAALVILASHTLGGEGDALFELLRGLAAGVGGGGGNSRHQPVRACHRHGRRDQGRALGARPSLERDRPSPGRGGDSGVAEGASGGLRLTSRVGVRTGGWRATIVA